MLANTLCSRCGVVETTVHLFFTVNFLKKCGVVFHGIRHLTHPAVPPSLKNSQPLIGKRNLPPPPTSITINLFPWVCWCIWISRNQLAFENRTATPTDTACKALHAAQEWERAQSLIKPSAINQAHTSPIFYLPTTFIACNTDGAWKADSLIEGSSWIFSTTWERSVEEESPTSMSPPP